MNTFINRFAPSPSTVLFKKAAEVVEDDDYSEMTWGSAAGFGNLGVSGIPKFTVPNLPDVSLS